MDRKNNRIGQYLKLPFQLAYIVVVTTVFATGCMITGVVSKHVAQAVCHTWARLVLAFLGVRVRVRGRHNLTRGERYIFFSNHQSALDIPVLFAGLRFPICFIAKKELFLIPFLGWGMAAMGHVKIDRSNVRKARESLTAGVRLLKRFRLSLVLFPEGTRSATGDLGEFKQGSFSLALQAGVAVVPVAISKANERLPKKSLFVNPGTVYIDICDPVDAEGMEKSELAAWVRREIERAMERP